MTRTRLDEIVQEEIHGIPETEPRTAVSIYSLERIAERAFRHGAEQASNLFNEGMGGPTVKAGAFDRLYVSGMPVQPAPAELSPRDEDSPKAQEKPCPHAVRVWGICTSPACRDDRRKAERRKGWEWKRVRPDDRSEWAYAFGNTLKTFGTEQRSGNDRRKS